MDISAKSSSKTGPSKAHQELESLKHLSLEVSESLHHLRFPKFKHDHPAIMDVNKEHEERLTMGAKIADQVAATVGSWRFIITQSIILALWIILNSVAWFYFHWDSYPYILLNLALSFQAAFAAPFVMMSQNRQADKDRLTAVNDYQTDQKGEEEIRHIMGHLDHQDELILQILQRLESQHQAIEDRMSKLEQSLASPKQ
ncbi:MAG TPA: DUF1003 domain-containing protein [Ktedonobacterales bacterium]|jgi:uncharacterized membrane protein